jgi:TetR/AcrR family transcriptional regulator
MEMTDWIQMHKHILELEQEGRVTRTFRRIGLERQRTILKAILEEAIEKGPTSIRIKQVAKKAGVSIGSLYQYFNNRDGLFVFAVELCARFMNDMFSSYGPLLSAMPLREGLAAYLTGGIDLSSTQAGLIQFFLKAAYQGDPELAESLVKPIGTTLRTIVREMLEAAAQRGELRANVDIETTVRIVHALMIAVGDSYLLPYLNNYFQVISEGTSYEGVMQNLLDLILFGIGVERNEG